jgi:transcriptional regulator with XRE-family HTH domain
MAAETRIGPAGWVLATNIKRVREAQRLSYAELARMLKDKAGQRIPVLGLRKIESMERRVDFDELLVLAYVLEVCPVDLMVSKDATDEPYAVTPEHEFEAQSVREWIRGESVRLVRPQQQQPVEPDLPLFADPAKSMLDALEWMPEERARRVGRRFFTDQEDPS